MTKDPRRTSLIETKVVEIVGGFLLGGVAWFSRDVLSLAEAKVLFWIPWWG